MSEAPKLLLDAIKQQKHVESLRLWPQVLRKQTKLSPKHAASILAAIGPRKDPRYHSIVKHLAHHHAHALNVDSLKPSNAIRIVLALQSAGEHDRTLDIVRQLEPVVWTKWDAAKQIDLASIVLKNKQIRDSVLNTWRDKMGVLLDPVVEEINVLDALDQGNVSRVVEKCANGFQRQLWSGSILANVVHSLMTALCEENQRDENKDELNDALRLLKDIVGKEVTFDKDSCLNAAYRTLLHFGPTSFPSSTSRFIKTLFQPSTISKHSFDKCFNVWENLSSLGVPMSDSTFSILLTASLREPNHLTTSSSLILSFLSPSSPNPIPTLPHTTVPNICDVSLTDISTPVAHALISFYTNASHYEAPESNPKWTSMMLSNALYVLSNAKQANRNVKYMTLMCLKAQCLYGLGTENGMDNAMQLLSELNESVSNVKVSGDKKLSKDEEDQVKKCCEKMLRRLSDDQNQEAVKTVVDSWKKLNINDTEFRDYSNRLL